MTGEDIIAELTGIVEDSGVVGSITKKAEETTETGVEKSPEPQAENPVGIESGRVEEEKKPDEKPPEVSP